MQGLFTIDKTKNEENDTKIMKVLPTRPSVVIPVWGKKVIYKKKLPQINFSIKLLVIFVATLC